MQEHDAKQLEKITIIMPNIGRGGPGLKKKFYSDFELESSFLNRKKNLLECSRCQKEFSRQDKTSFRKHLQYHFHKEKNYVYQCSQCPREFNDSSNLKRHIHTVHEKQLFRFIFFM